MDSGSNLTFKIDDTTGELTRGDGIGEVSEKVKVTYDKDKNFIKIDARDTDKHYVQHINKAIGTVDSITYDANNNFDMKFGLCR
jgi:capsular polysaccharide biosynthesis protein